MNAYNPIQKMDGVSNPQNPASYGWILNPPENNHSGTDTKKPTPIATENPKTVVPAQEENSKAVQSNPVEQETAKPDTQSHRLGDTLQSDGRYYQVTGVDNNGNPTGIEVDKNGNDVTAGGDNPIISIPKDSERTGENSVDTLQQEADKRAEVANMMRGGMSFIDAHKQIYGERPKDMTKKQKRWLAAIDGITFLLNVVGQTIGVAQGGNPVAMKQTSVLGQIRDNLIKNQENWDNKAIDALNKDIANGVSMYKLGVTQEGKDKDRELKATQYGQELAVKIEKLELDRAKFKTDTEYKNAMLKATVDYRKGMLALGYSNAEIAKLRLEHENSSRGKGGKINTSNFYKYSVKGKDYYISTKQREQITTAIAHNYGSAIAKKINDADAKKNFEYLIKGISSTETLKKGDAEENLMTVVAKIDPDLLERTINYYLSSDSKESNDGDEKKNSSGVNWGDYFYQNNGGLNNGGSTPSNQEPWTPNETEVVKKSY